MRRAIAIFGFTAGLAVAAGSFILLPNGTSNAAGAKDAIFLIPAIDGYGVADCLTASGDSECGQVVANAWCESQGFARAASFGRAEADDTTGSIENAAATDSVQRPIVITCAN